MKIFKAALLASAMIMSMPALAADEQAQAPQEAGYGDIIVTANRTQSLASKTPVALTAVTGEALIKAGVVNPTQLGDQVPNLSIDRANGLQITIRGVTSSDGTEKGDPSAAFMIDGIYIARPQVQEVSFFDVERVEVLRGPQGTLFGRNTTAGLVNILTNKPKLGVTEGSVDLSYGNYDSRQATGVINLPVGEKVALRFAANYEQRDSFLRTGPRFTTSLDPFRKNISLRGSALFDLGRGQLVLRGDYSWIKGVTTNSLPTGQFFANFNTPGVDPLYIGNGSTDSRMTLNIPFSGPLQRDNRTWGAQGDLDYDLGPVTVNYLGSYRSFHRVEDGVGYLAGAIAIPNTYAGSFWQTSHELRLVTNGDGPLKAQAGAYYFKEKSAIGFYLLGLLSPTPGTTGYVYGFPQDPTIAESYAFFGQATYSLTDRLRLTGGIRYSHDLKSRIGAIVRCGTLACDASTDTRTPNAARRNFARTTWRAGIDYDLNDRSLLYGVVATGYKAGGFNDGCEAGTGAGCTLPAAALYYEPETLTSYEVGLKTRFANNAVRLNLSAFHYDYDGIQLSQAVTINNAPFQVTTNAAKAKVDGVEAEGVIEPVRNSRFDASVTWLNARYTDYQPSATIDWSGKKLDRSPEWVFSAGYTQTFDLANGGNIQAGARTRVSDSFRLAALGTLNQFRVPGYSKTDVTLTYNAPGDRWYVQAFGKNLENSIVVTTASTGAFGTVQVADPRTYGVRTGFRF
ncbi:TonB-dependent receptor [Sphingobium sp. Sx8-8]|uniref:TonB-dependent receptor n=1 Tax=Sphingobium sp. Sx8-8 TaxID=2933617 RepID=UPI001F580831|nr:TonB-dependent receptor [Sphingobium sp. Sx8-8]